MSDNFKVGGTGHYYGEEHGASQEHPITTHSVTITRGNESLNGEVDRRIVINGSNPPEYPVYDSITGDMTGNIIGTVSKEQFDAGVTSRFAELESNPEHQDHLKQFPIRPEARIAPTPSKFVDAPASLGGPAQEQTKAVAELAATPEQTLQQKNEFSIARGEIMFETFKQYNLQDNSGLSREEQIKRLEEINTQVANGNNRVPENERSQIAAEFQGLLHDKDKTDQVLTMANSRDVKDLTKKDMPQLPKGNDAPDYGVDLGTATDSDKATIASKLFVGGHSDAVAKLITMNDLNKSFADAAQKSGVLNNGETVGGLLDHYKPAAEQQAAAAQNVPSAAAPEAAPLTETQQRMEDNKEFIATRYVMAKAIQQLHQQEKDYKQVFGREMPEKDKRDALVHNIDESVAGRKDLNEDQKAKIAIQWEKSIRDPNHNIVGFVDDAAIKKDLSGSIPNLPTNVDYGVNLKTVKVDEMSDLEKVRLAMDVQARTGVEALDLQNLSTMNKDFEAAAKKAGLIDYDKSNLTEKFAAIEISPQELEAKKAALKAIENDPQKKAQQQEEEKDKEKAPAQNGGIADMLKGLMGGDMGGIGMIIMAIVAIFTGMFSGKGNQVAQGHHAASTPAGAKEKEDRQNEANHLAQFYQKDKDHHIDTKDLVHKDGKINMPRIAAVLGENPDKPDEKGHRDGKLSAEELKSADDRLKLVIAENPKIREIGEDFRKAMAGLKDAGEHANTALPNAVAQNADKGPAVGGA